MTPKLLICAACGHAHYPTALLCFDCASPDLAPKPATVGEVEQITDIAYQVGGAQNGPLFLNVIRTEEGARILARSDSALVPGTRVSLTMAGAMVRALP